MNIDARDNVIPIEESWDCTEEDGPSQPVVGKSTRDKMLFVRDIKGNDLPIAVCMTCGSNHFRAGLGVLTTAISCIYCGWEKIVHQG